MTVVDERTELRAPYRGIAPFRLVDAPIFFAREREVRDLFRHVAVYRGVLLYGDSGVGKSSLINAGFIPLAMSEGFLPERIRIQKRRGQEIVVERISTRADGGPPYLPSFLSDGDLTASHTVLSVEAFEKKLREAAVYEASRNAHPVLIFDQFEEFVTLFDSTCGGDGEEVIDSVRSGIAATLIELIHDHRIPVKFLFVFREDYLAKLGVFFRETPDLPGHNVRLAPPAREELDAIIRGPFERFPGHFPAELPPELADCMIAEIVARNGSQAVNLSELQIACLTLWQSSDPIALFRTRGLEGLLEDYLSEAFSQFRKELRDPCLVLLSRMITPSGTRNVIARHDLVREGAESTISCELLDRSLVALEEDARLIRREHRRDVDYYEIVSEFLVPWIVRKAAERRAQRQEQARLRQGIRRAASIVGAAVLLVVVSSLPVVLWQLKLAEGAQAAATSRELAAHANAQLAIDPQLSLLLAVEASNKSTTGEAMDALRQSLLASRLRRELQGHTDTIARAVFSPDGRLVATASADGDARVWDTVGQSPVMVLRGHTDKVVRVTFSPDGQQIVTASKDQTARVWETQTGALLTVLRGHSGPVMWAEFSPDGRQVVTASEDGATRLWDAATGEMLFEIRGDKEPMLVATFSPDGRLLATAGTEATVRIWDTATGKMVRELVGHQDIVNSVAFSADGDQIVTASSDETAQVWKTTSGARVATLSGHRGVVTDASFSSDGRTVVTAGQDRTARIWDVQEERPIFELRGHTGQVNTASFSRDGRFIVTASADGTARLWESNHGRLVVELRGHTGGVNSAAFSLDGQRIVTASQDRTARVWEASSGTVVDRRPGRADTVGVVTRSADWRFIAKVTADGALQVWDTDTGDLAAELRGPTSKVTTVAFSPDRRLVATASRDGTAWVWEAVSGRPLVELAGHAGGATSVAFSDDGRLLATTSGDETARIWEVNGGRLVVELRGHSGRVTAADFSPDGRLVATASRDGTARVWMTDTGQLETVLRKDPEIVNSTDFSPDGRLIVTASADGTARVWEADSGRLVDEVRDQSGPIYSAALSSDGRHIVTTSEDGTKLTYVCETCGSAEDLVELARSRLARELSPKEREKYLH